MMKIVKANKDQYEDEILVIHALGVHPAYSGKGYAKEMVLKSGPARIRRLFGWMCLREMYLRKSSTPV